jgi:hypothetical protein
MKMLMTVSLMVNTEAIVKEAFNAMIQASTNLTHKPKKLDLSEVDFDWTTLKQAILDAHKPIADVFFQGHGNHLAVHR